MRTYSSVEEEAENFHERYFSDEADMVQEVKRIYRASLGLYIQLLSFIAIDNLGNRESIEVTSPLLFTVVDTPDDVLLWKVTSNRIIPVWNIEPYGWLNSDYCSYMVETPIEFNLTQKDE